MQNRKKKKQNQIGHMDLEMEMEAIQASRFGYRRAVKQRGLEGEEEGKKYKNQ